MKCYSIYLFIFYMLLYSYVMPQMPAGKPGEPAAPVGLVKAGKICSLIYFYV